MSIVRFTDPPEPPVSGQVWCTFCLMLAKHKLTKDRAEEMQAAATDDKGRDAEHWIPWDTSIKLFVGRYRAMSDWTALGLLDLCWTHVAGIEMTRMSPIERAGQLPPGLLRGRG